MAGRGEQKTPGSGTPSAGVLSLIACRYQPSPWRVTWENAESVGNSAHRGVGTSEASECAVDERGDRPLRPVGHARGDVALLLGLRDALDQRLRDGELVLQQPDRPFPEILRQRAEARRRHPVPGPPSAGGDLLGPPA